MNFFTVNPNLIIQALVNTDDYDAILQIPKEETEKKTKERNAKITKSL